MPLICGRTTWTVQTDDNQPQYGRADPSVLCRCGQVRCCHAFHALTWCLHDYITVKIQPCLLFRGHYASALKSSLRVETISPRRWFSLETSAIFIDPKLARCPSPREEVSEWASSSSRTFGL